MCYIISDSKNSDSAPQSRFPSPPPKPKEKLFQKNHAPSPHLFPKKN